MLKPESNNKDIYDVGSLLQSTVKFESLHLKREIS